MPQSQEEAEFAAALIRRLCRTRGWRYRDFALVLATQDQALTGALNRAFQLYKVPLFLTQGRSADKHPLSACLLSALRAVTRGWALADLVGYIRSGFSGLTGQEADLLVNYAQPTAFGVGPGCPPDPGGGGGAPGRRAPAPAGDTALSRPGCQRQGS